MLAASNAISAKAGGGLAEGLRIGLHERRAGSRVGGGEPGALQPAQIGGVMRPGRRTHHLHLRRGDIVFRQRGHRGFQQRTGAFRQQQRVERGRARRSLRQAVGLRLHRRVSALAGRANLRVDHAAAMRVVGHLAQRRVQLQRAAVAVALDLRRRVGGGRGGAGHPVRQRVAECVVRQHGGHLRFTHRGQRADQPRHLLLRRDAQRHTRQAAPAGGPR